MLFKVAAFGGIATISTGMILQSILQRRVRDAEVYRQAMDILKKNPAAEAFLGKPIYTGNLDLQNKENYCYSNKANLEIPIKGSKMKGVLYFSAERPSSQEKWKFHKMELELQDEYGGRLDILEKVDSENKNYDVSDLY